MVAQKHDRPRRWPVNSRRAESMSQGDPTTSNLRRELRAVHDRAMPLSNKDLVRRHFEEILNRKRLDACEELIAEGRVRLRFGPGFSSLPLRQRRAGADFLATFWRPFGDFEKAPTTRVALAGRQLGRTERRERVRGVKISVPSCCGSVAFVNESEELVATMCGAEGWWLAGFAGSVVGGRARGGGGRGVVRGAAA